MKRYEKVRQLVDSLDREQFVALLYSLGFQVNRNLQMLSPFRAEKHPSLSFWRYKNTHWKWRDFGDPDRWGDIFDLVKHVYQLESLEEAAKFVEQKLAELNLSQKVEIKPQKEQKSVEKTPEEVLAKVKKFYAIGRRAKENDVVATLRCHGFLLPEKQLLELYKNSDLLVLQFSKTKERILGYPFRNSKGDLVGLFLRIPRQDENRFAYLGRKCLMVVERSSKELFCCEGLRDLIALSLLFPDKSIVAFAGNPSDFALQELKKFLKKREISKVITAFDNDDAGKKILQEVAKILPVSKLKYEGKDPFEFLRLRIEQLKKQRLQDKICLECRHFPAEAKFFQVGKMCRVTHEVTWADQGACGFLDPRNDEFLEEAKRLKREKALEVEPPPQKDAHPPEIEPPEPPEPEDFDEEDFNFHP